MAKSNLKTLNNNNVTQLSPCSLYSKNSFTYSIYIYLQYITFFNFFLFKENYNNLKFSLLKNQLSVYKYYNFFKKKIVKINKFYTYNIIFKLFFINGVYTYIYDFYFILKKSKKKPIVLLKSTSFFSGIFIIKPIKLNFYNNML